MKQPTHYCNRRQTRPVKVGNLTLGGNHPIRVQSMTSVPTRDVERCLDQIRRLIDAGCEIVRVAVPTKDDTAALPQILKYTEVPVVADVHFHFRRALEAIEAGVHKIRLNPGNIEDRQQVAEVIDACKSNNVAIRVGVNEGSIRPKGYREGNREELIQLIIAKISEYMTIFTEKQFENLIISAKCHDGRGTIAVNRAISEHFPGKNAFPLHLGVTHSGTPFTGSVKSAASLGVLLAEGIGDTIRISLAGDPVLEIKTAWDILTTLGLREPNRPELIACPTCGRTEIDLLDMVEQAEKALQHIKKPITVAIMGCVVNGPGEAGNADVALCGGREKAVLYRNGQRVATVSADNAIKALLEQVELSLAE